MDTVRVVAVVGMEKAVTVGGVVSGAVPLGCEELEVPPPPQDTTPSETTPSTKAYKSFFIGCSFMAFD
jgi:hypothetical protein